jgi:hypothetical protein
MPEMKVQLGPVQADIGDGRGPQRGQFCLQQALLKNKPDWLTISNERIPDDTIPWFWSCHSSYDIVECHLRKRPFIIGPNVLFGNSRHPKYEEYESIVCSSPHCRLIFTESDWYSRLIRENLSSESKAKVCVVPYPVTQMTDKYVQQFFVARDLLIFCKSGYDSEDVALLFRKFNCTIAIYGNYRHDWLPQAAATSKLCLYLSDDDRGPLAAAEILLTGCPIIGTEQGCPWVREIYGVGYELSCLEASAIIKIIGRAMNTDLPRQAVRRRAKAFFDPCRVSQIVINELEAARKL